MLKKFFCFVVLFASVFGYCSDEEDASRSDVHAEPSQARRRGSRIGGKDAVERSFRSIHDNCLVFNKYIGTEASSFLLATKLHLAPEKITEIQFLSSLLCEQDMKTVATVKSLQTLVFEETDFDKKALGILRSSSVVNLVFCGCECSPATIDSLFSLPSLRSLTLDRVWFGDFYSEELAKNSSLKKLVISSVPFGEQFTQSINANKSLELVALQDGIFIQHLKSLIKRTLTFFI